MVSSFLHVFCLGNRNPNCVTTMKSETKRMDCTHLSTYACLNWNKSFQYVLIKQYSFKPPVSFSV